MDIADLLTENEQLRTENAQLRAENQQLRQQVTTLEARVAALEAELKALKELLETTQRQGKRQATPSRRAARAQRPRSQAGNAVTLPLSGRCRIKLIAPKWQCCHRLVLPAAVPSRKATSSFNNRSISRAPSP